MCGFVSNLGTSLDGLKGRNEPEHNRGAPRDIYVCNEQKKGHKDIRAQFNATKPAALSGLFRRKHESGA